MAEAKALENSYTIGKRKFKLTPLKGKRARHMVPRIIETAAAALNLAASNGVDLLSLFDENAPVPTGASLVTTVYSISQYLGDKYAEIEEEVFPVLLCAEAEQWIYIDEEATPIELYTALWTAIKYHLPSSFGLEVQEALKNLQEATPDEEVAEPVE